MRQVQFYLKDGRIGGAVRPGHDWLIPINTVKPESRLKEKQPPPNNPLPLDLLKIIEATTFLLPRENPDAILSIVGDSRLRLHYESFY